MTCSGSVQSMSLGQPPSVCEMPRSAGSILSVFACEGESGAGVQRGGSGGDRATHIVLRLVGGDLDDGVHRITLDVVLLELGFGAEVRDDLRGG